MTIKETEKLPKDHKSVKAAQSMTAGVTTNKLEAGATIDLHGHPVKITHTDDTDTTVQYGNLARRTFETHILNSYLDLKTFPVGAAFERPTAPAERAVIEAVTGDCCYQVRITIGSEEPFHLTFIYADFIAWHMENNSRPGETRISAIPTALIIPSDSKPEADEPDDDSNPFEEELKKGIERLEKELEQAEINGQTRINALLSERAELTANIATIKSSHDTIIAGYEEDIKRLEAKAAILNPEPTRKEVCTLVQKLHNPELVRAADNELAEKLSAQWSIQNTTILYLGGETNDYYTRFVTLTRDIPAEPAPKLLVTEAAAAIYGLHIGAVPLTQRPPMPANQTIIHQPTSRALTNNGPKPGETKRIPTLAEIEARRKENAAEINDIVQRGLDAHEALRKQFANSPHRSFNVTGAR